MYLFMSMKLLINDDNAVLARTHRKRVSLAIQVRENIAFSHVMAALTYIILFLYVLISVITCFK